MNNKKPFFSGLALGIVIMLIINIGFYGYRYATIGVEGLSAKQTKVLTQKTETLLSYLNKYYLEPVDEEKLVEGSFEGMIASVGDPYTNYFDEDRFKRFMEDTEGAYAGIGVIVKLDETDRLVTVVMPFEDSPGEKAGLLPEDKILKVNGEDVTGLELEEVAKKLKGPEGTDVNATIFRPSTREDFEVTLTREIISMPTVRHEMLEDQIGYLKIIGFDAVTYKQFIEALADLERQNQKGMIIDLRDNPGGRLDIVSQIADTMLPEGVITYTEDKTGHKEYLKSSDKRLFNKPLVILVNGNSASASEILAGAVKDHNTGKLVGTTTFGKGLVQRIFPLRDGSAIKVTIAKYYTPSGNYINKKGIEPDFTVELPEELKYKIVLTKDEDIQLKKAIEVLESSTNN